MQRLSVVKNVVKESPLWKSIAETTEDLHPYNFKHECITVEMRVDLVSLFGRKLGQPALLFQQCDRLQRGILAITPGTALQSCQAHESREATKMQFAKGPIFQRLTRFSAQAFQFHNILSIHGNTLPCFSPCKSRRHLGIENLRPSSFSGLLFGTMTHIVSAAGVGRALRRIRLYATPG